MSKRSFFALATLTVVAAVASAAVVAPRISPYINPPERIAAAWADHYDSIDKMAADVDAVVVASVSDVRPGRKVAVGSGVSLPFTLVDLSVTQVVRGTADARITVEQTGGQVDGVQFYVDGDGGLYEVGNQVMLFLKRQPDTGFFYLVHPQGRFHVTNGRLDAVLPDDPVSAALDRLPVTEAVQRVAH